MIKVIRCPCCGDEIPIQIEGDGNDVTVTFLDIDDKRIFHGLELEFGQQGGDKRGE